MFTTCPLNEPLSRTSPPRNSFPNTLSLLNSTPPWRGRCQTRCYKTRSEGFVSYWDALDLTDGSLSPANREFAEIFSKKTRAVFSRTLVKMDDKAILIKDNIAAEVSKLKRQPGRDLTLVCGPDLFATLIQLGLIDEYRLMVLPIALGRGKALFGGLQAGRKLKLLATRVFASGTALHHYRPADMR